MNKSYGAREIPKFAICSVFFEICLSYVDIFEERTILD